MRDVATPVEGGEASANGATPGSAMVGMCDEDGMLIAVNAALSDLLGLSPTQMIGRPFLSFVHAEDRAASMARYFASIAADAGRGVRVETGRLRCLHRDGSTVRLDVEWTISCSTRSPRRYAVVQLRPRSATHVPEPDGSAGRYEIAFSLAAIGMAVMSMQGRFLETNPALRQMLGYTGDELAQLSFAEVSDPRDRAASEVAHAALVSGQITVHEAIKRYRHHDGHTVTARRIATIARDEHGGPLCIVLQIEPLPEGDHPPELAATGPLYDPHTGLPTTRGLELELTGFRGSRSLVLVRVADLATMTTSDNVAADPHLATIAAIIRCCPTTGAVVGRLSADALAVVLPDDDRGSFGTAVAQRIAATLTEPIMTGAGTTQVSATVGVDHDLRGVRPLAALVERATLAAQLEGGSSSFGRFRPQLLARSHRALALERDLPQALASNQLTLVYQPIVTLDSLRPVAVEALSRWNHATYGPVPAAEIVTVAEHIGVISELTTWALRTAAGDLAQWDALDCTGPHLAMNVNISPTSLPDPGLGQQLHGIASEHGLDLDRFVLELTESVCAQDSTLDSDVRRLRALGIGLALDDFSVGHSSLVRLARLPFTHLKLDQSLLDPAIGRERVTALLRATIELALAFDLIVTAEGVETDDQLAILRTCGCTHAQGYLLARPRPAAAIADLLRSAQR